MRLTLSDVRAYIASLGIATCVYAGNLDTKKTESIGVYDRDIQKCIHTIRR